MSDRPGDQDRQNERPMLILGEEVPDVEDTTVEQLRDQQAKLEARRAELAVEIEREREKSQERLESDRREAELALSRRQREIDDAERSLHRTERRLVQKAARLGQSHRLPALRGKQSGSHSDSDKSGGARLLAGARAAANRRVPRAFPAIVLLGLGSIALVAGSVVAHSAPTQEQLSAFASADEAHTLLRESALAIDEEALRSAAQQEIPVDADGELGSVALLNEAAQLYELPTYYADDIVEHGEAVLSEATVNPVRIATGWQEARRAAQYSVASYEVSDIREELGPSGWGTALLWSGCALFLMAALVLASGGAVVAASLTALALVPAGLLVASDPALGGTFREAAEQHDETMDTADDILDIVERDLQIVFSLGESRNDPDYWREPSYVVEPESEQAQAVINARNELGEVLSSTPDQQELGDAGVVLVEAAKDMLEARSEDVSSAHEGVLNAAQGSDNSGRKTLALVLALVMPAVGLGAEMVLRRRITS